MKKALIVACFDSYSYNLRTKYIENFLLRCGYEVNFLVSNFDHRTKTNYKTNRDNITYIKVPRYSSNMSIKRIISHLIFSIKVRLKLMNSHYDVIYVTTPPNILFFLLRNINGKVIFEIGDLWPETFPYNKISVFKKILFYFWKSIRDISINSKNIYIFECSLFESIIKNRKKNLYIKGGTLYLCKSSKERIILEKNHILNEELVNLLYLGSINNIIDIDFIIAICKKLNRYKKSNLIIVGDGEKKKDLINLLMHNSIMFEDYGMVFNENEKLKIFSKCDFSLNIMKTTVCVGLTMKSIDYFYYNIPIINCIPHDTYEIVNKYKCGYNISYDNIDQIVEKLAKVSPSEYLEMKKNTEIVFNHYFNEQYFYEKFSHLVGIKDNN